MAWKMSMMRAWLMMGCATVVSCKQGGGPVVQDPGDQVAVVGHQLNVDVFATDPDGDSLRYSFNPGDLPDVAASLAAFTVAPDGHGVFSITPVASQLGEHIIDFIVSDGRNKTTVPVHFSIQGAGGDGTQPVFRKPQGLGIPLDLSVKPCVEFDVLVTDLDSTQVTLEQRPPLIEGAELRVDPSGFEGVWSWCPSAAQIAGAQRYPLTLTAQDESDNPPTVKDFAVILRRGSGSECPGAPPTVSHEPGDATGQLDIAIDVEVSDDNGVKQAPVLLYAYEDPGTPVDFGTLTVSPTPMRLVTGDATSGTWRGYIPNQTAASGQGTEADVWYVVSVTDNDDAEGTCDHTVDSPAAGAHKVHVVNDGSGVAGLCEVCSYDVQCGAENLCLTQHDGNYCGSACAGAGDCEAEYLCSGAPVQSVEGAMARQCVPTTNTCVTAPAGPCTEDGFEENDTLEQATAALPLNVEHEAGLCNGDRDDWYQVELTAAADLAIKLDWAGPGDLELALTNRTGVLLESSTGVTSPEEIQSDCVAAGTFYVRVYGYETGDGGNYRLRIDADTQSCDPSQFTGDCCAEHDERGCGVPAVSNCVCALDPSCCSFGWGDSCVWMAGTECDAGCVFGGGDHDCCTEGTKGCNDPAIERCVCDENEFFDCCVTEWHEGCVNLAQEDCGLSCSDSVGNCCEIHSGVGCENAAIEACVCAADSDCCNAQVTGWDSWCVEQVEVERCGTCPGS